MAGQLSFAGFDSEQANDRLFLAVFPPPEVAQQITLLRQNYCQKLNLRGNVVSSERLHVTLHHLGDYAGLPPAIITGAKQAATSLMHAPIELTFNRLTRFAANQHKPMLVLCGDDSEMAALHTFRQQLSQALVKAGLGKQLIKTFTPHITLLYGAAEFSEQMIEPIRWTAHEFVLVHSLLRQTKHIPLASWPLQ